MEIILESPIIKLLHPPVEPLLKICFQQRSRIRIKQRDTMKASASGDQFPFFTDHIVIDLYNIASVQPFSGRYRLFLPAVSLVRIPRRLHPSRKIVIPFRPFS